MQSLFFTSEDARDAQSERIDAQRCKQLKQWAKQQHQVHQVRCRQ